MIPCRQFRRPMSKKSVFCIVSKVHYGPVFLDAPCLAGQDTVQNSSNCTVDKASGDIQLLPIHRRNGLRQFGWDIMSAVPGSEIILAVKAPQ